MRVTRRLKQVEEFGRWKKSFTAIRGLFSLALLSPSQSALRYVRPASPALLMMAENAISQLHAMGKLRKRLLSNFSSAGGRSFQLLQDLGSQGNLFSV